PMRDEISILISKGPLPSSTANAQQIQDWQATLDKISVPLSDDEAEALIALFSAREDDCFGLAWSLVHLVETSPHCPIQRCLNAIGNPWIALLRERSSI